MGEGNASIERTENGYVVSTFHPYIQKHVFTELSKALELVARNVALHNPDHFPIGAEIKIIINDVEPV